MEVQVTITHVPLLSVAHIWHNHMYFATFSWIIDFMKCKLFTSDFEPFQKWHHNLQFWLDEDQGLQKNQGLDYSLFPR